MVDAEALGVGYPRGVLSEGKALSISFNALVETSNCPENTLIGPSAGCCSVLVAERVPLWNERSPAPYHPTVAQIVFREYQLADCGNTD